MCRNESKTIYPFAPESQRWRSIFFGHQSVGSDILDGIRLQTPKIRIAPLGTDCPSPAKNTIFHARIGNNFDPSSKIQAFLQILETSKQDFDIAMMKFCYVDIVKSTDINSLFEQYASMVEDVQSLRPDLDLIHVTAPLRSNQTGARSILKSILGRPIDPIEDNLKREAFNSLLRSRFGSNRGFFDLAVVESTKPNGSSSFVRYGRHDVRNLYVGYTRDGGHLNNTGKQAIARALLTLLSRMRQN